MKYKYQTSNAKYLFFLFILIFFSGCQEFETNSKSVAIKLFDIKPIVAKDIEQNEKNKNGQRKIISINHKQDIVLLDDVDWKKDLQILIDSDINKKDWEDKFTLQTVKQQNLFEIEKYVAISNKVPIKQLAIIRNATDSIVEEIFIEKNIRSGLFSNNQTITYKPSNYLKIKSIQKALFMKDFISEVEIYFIEK